MAKALTKPELAAQVASLTASLQRERADADNLRRRAELDQLQATAQAQQAAVAKLLPILDNLERAFSQPPQKLKTDNWVKGVLGLQKQFQGMTARLGLERIETIGLAFDADCMEAVVVDDKGGKKEQVVEELQSGWRLHGQLLRVALVKVQN